MDNRADGSEYSTFDDEVQSQMGNTGKPLQNMNLDELMQSVTSSNQISGQKLVQNPSASSASCDHNSFLFGNIGFNGTTLSNKTINQVWREIVDHQQHVNLSVENHLQHSSLGEITLEEFLARAGMIINNNNNNNSDNNVGNQDNNFVADSQPITGIDSMVMASHNQDNWLPLQMQMQHPSINFRNQRMQEQQQQQQNNQKIITMCPTDFGVPKPEFENPNVEIGHSENPLGISMTVASMSSSTACSDSKGPVLGKKRRFSNDMVDKTIERRQKRMAKNRESAAKSRAKKQAYIDKLESDKSRLLKSNHWLKKLKEAEARLLSDTTLTPKYQLRRTNSNTF